MRRAMLRVDARARTRAPGLPNRAVSSPVRLVDMSGAHANTAQPRELGSTLAATLTTSSSSIAVSPAEPVAPGTIIGRYVVLSKLGAGAMGVVFAAYDPELDRKVALKLLKASPGAQDAARA